MILDLNGDKKLDYLHDEEIFKQNDIIRIHTKNYKLSYVNPDGMKIILEETKEEPTKYFARWDDISYDDHKYSLEQEFWDNKFTDVNGNLIHLENLKGKFLLLNFWGEWCKPCQQEIPFLINAKNKYSSNVEYIKFHKNL